MCDYRYYRHIKFINATHADMWQWKVQIRLICMKPQAAPTERGSENTVIWDVRTRRISWPFRRQAGPRRELIRLARLALGLIGLVGATARSSELEELNPSLAAQVHLKVLAYDRNLPAHARGRVTLGILYRADREESERMRSAMQAAFQKQGASSNLRGIPLAVTAVPLGDPRTLLKRLQDAGVNTLYITPGLEDAAGSIRSAASALQAPTLTGRRDLLDAGLAIAVVTDGERPVIVVNLAVAKALGMDLDPSLLRLAEVKR